MGMLRLERVVGRGLSKGNVSELVASELKKVEVEERQETIGREQGAEGEAIRNK